MAHKHSVYDTDTHFLIDGETRAVTNSGSTTASIFQYDHNSERFTFEMPRVIDGHDMTECNVVQLHYQNVDKSTRAANRGIYEIEDLQISPDDENVIIFSWLISQNATKYAGELKFNMRFACVSEDGTIDYAWSTATYGGVSVAGVINNSETVIEESVDLIEQWNREIEANATAAATNAATEAIETRIAEAESSGEFDGATFTPYVDEQGYLSWANDSGLENPATVNIKGEQGEKGDDYVLTDDDKSAIAAEVLASDDISQMAQDIADLKYVEIKFNSINNSVGTVEMGSTVNRAVVSWTTNKTPVSLTVDGESVDANANSVTYDTPITESKTYTVTATDERQATATATTSINFHNGVYYGVLAAGATIDNAAILGLTKKLQGSKAITFTANAGAGQNIVYALPSRYGTPGFNVGGFDGGFSKANTLAFTNASGYTENYDVWISDNTGLGSTTVKVS